MTFAQVKSGESFILESDGCCYVKIGFFALRPHKANTYSIADDASVTIIAPCARPTGALL